MALARLLATKPPVFLMDEPLLNFDARLRMDMRVELKRFQSDADATTVYVTHDQTEALTLLNKALPNELVWNFIPDSVARELTDAEMSPLLIQRRSSRIVYYNTALNPDGAPIDSLWDMTREEWTGRTLLPSPLEDSLSANFIQTTLANPDDMAAAMSVNLATLLAILKRCLRP